MLDRRSAFVQIERMDIAEYLEHAKISPEAFGELIGRDGTTVRRWLAGAEIKSGDMVAMIRVTHKAITAEALLRAHGKRAVPV